MGTRRRLSRTDTGMKRGKTTSSNLAKEGGLVELCDTWGWGGIEGNEFEYD